MLKTKAMRKKFDIRSILAKAKTAPAKCGFIVFSAFVVCAFLFCIACAPVRYSLTVGSISHATITATKDVIDQVATDEKRKAAAASVEPTYCLKDGASNEVMTSLKDVLDQLRTVQTYGLTLRSADDTDSSVATRNFSSEELEYAKKLVTAISLNDYQATTLLRTGSAAFDTMASSVTVAVESALSTTIREGQLNQSISAIMQIVGFKVDVSLLQNIVPSVLRAVVKPNMVIDTESTDIARSVASDTVEPIVYLQGQNIVREGERVSQNQIEMLQTLGLLTNNRYDYSIYLGAVMLVALAVGVFVLLLRLLDSQLLHNIRKLSVAMLVMLISEAVAILVMKWLNIFIVPTVMASMLLTVLLGYGAGVAGTFSISIIVAGLAAGYSGTGYSLEMIYLLLSGTLGGIICVKFLMKRPQRMRILLVGIITSIVNCAILVALNLMTSATFSHDVVKVGYVLVSGLLSGLIAVGIQPLFETVFNLATPSKLMELANPNQPLMRRLLLEAPGTYHHSIIVANLSEAAAEKIGANPYLARAGAYYHDIGKLKRPTYFKENQMGENPHDRTDPYVSAAIVTSHTRDGVTLAQKYHLPAEIQQIIFEHHGDTPVLFFYHKAVEAANGNPVNISDFRYDGERPSSKESAIIMLADTIEAAVRSMKDPTPESIAAFIDKLVRGKLNDGQLNDSPLTLQDIDSICAAFCTVLHGVFHERIEYPDQAIPERNTIKKPVDEKEQQK